jgi:hypothetical protein
VLAARAGLAVRADAPVARVAGFALFGRSRLAMWVPEANCGSFASVSLTSALSGDRANCRSCAQDDGA